MSGVLYWQGHPIPFRAGDTAAIALSRAGVLDLGASASGRHHTVFCGIGQCQGCLVGLPDGAVTEACLLPCSDGLKLIAPYDAGAEDKS